MLQFIKSCLVIFACLFMLSVAHANDAELYQIEVIVFEHNDSNRFRGENWPKFAGILDTTNALNLDTLTNNSIENVNQATALVAAKNYLLKNEIKVLQASTSERFIKHIAWQQVLPNNVKSSIYFSSGAAKEVAATVAIKPNRNMFSVNIGLLYQIQPADRKYAPEIEEIKVVRDIRVKKREAFYVDHPVIGMIIIVSPLASGTNTTS